MARHRESVQARLRDGAITRPLRIAALGFVLGLASFLIAVPALAEPAPHGLVAGTPCTASAKACVDLASQRAWLLRDGQVIRGPAPIRSGDVGRETTVGTFSVAWKSRDHVSSETGGPMPYSVFFDTRRGVAFHEGRLSNASLGCVRLDRADAIAFFNYLKIGDQVQVH